MLKKFALYAIILLLVNACSTGSENQATAEGTSSDPTDDTVKETVADSTKFKFDLAVANIPPPASNIQQLEQMGLPYDHSLINDLNKASTYNDEFKKAVNLGIYNIDMAYAMINQNSQDVINCMKTVMSLSEGLGLKNTIASAIGKRAETNAGNRDSLIRIFDDLFDKSDAYLRTNERLYTASLIFAGSWVESLNINCKMADKTGDTKAKAQARRILWEQRFHLKNLMQILNDYRAEKEMQMLHTGLDEILKAITVIKKPEDIKDSDFSAISEKIYSLRGELTK